MTTATLYSPILLSHLSTLMNHLYNVLYACVYACVYVRERERFLNCLRVASCVYEPIIFTYLSPNDYFEMSKVE